MKYLVVLFALFIGYTATYAQFNAAVPSGDVTLSTKIFQQLIIEKNGPSSFDLPNVIKNQVRTFSNGEKYVVFHIQKEEDANVQFHVDFTVYDKPNGVKIAGTWIFMPGNIDLLQVPGAPASVIPQSGEWYWGDPTNPGSDPDDMTVVLRVDAIDATGSAVVAGDVAHFTATMSGYYFGI